MTERSNLLDDPLNDALKIATAIAYTKRQIDKLKGEIDELKESKDTRQVLVEYVQGPSGPKGEQGVRGFIGPQGPQGEIGLQGPQGLQGEKGARGDDGLPGPIGLRGAQGETGPQGPQGIKGDKGDTGERGEVGPKGDKGDKGDKGEQGTPGKNGLDGRDGAPGAMGPAGPAGAQGIQGERGPKGDTGRTGPQGVQGSPGTKGEPGPQGLQGVPGKDGKDADVTPIIADLESRITLFQNQLAKDLADYKQKIQQAISKGMIAIGHSGGGEVNLRYLDDVDTTNLIDGYVLTYNSTTRKFEFTSPTAASFNATDVKQVFAEIKNAESFTITKGQAVYLYQATGNKASVKLAYNTGDATSAKTLGLVYDASITPGGTGLVITQGVLTGVNTQAYQEGDTLYLANTAGNLTATKPYAPNHLVYIGVVERANQGQGQIYVRPQNGYELHEIHDVNINHNVALANADILVYNSALSIWENRQVSYLGLSSTDSTARATAAAAYSQANTGTTLAQAAYDYANTIVVPTTVSQLTNDSGYITTAALSTYATQSYVSNSISAIVDSAPALLDTLNELAAALGDDANFVTTINTTVSTVYSTANAAYSQANSANTLATSANTLAQSAFNQANTATTNASTAQTTGNNAYATANAAYSQANTGTILASSAFSQANTATTNAATAQTTADNAYSTANASYSQANTATTNAATAQATANQAWATANNKNYTIFTVSSNTAIDSSYNGSVVVCDSSSTIYISVANTLLLDSGFNFKLYPINSGSIYVTCNGASDSIATGFLRRTEVLLNRNAEVVKLANTIFALFE